MADLAVLDGEIAVPGIHGAYIGISDAAARYRVQGAQGEIFHERHPRAAELSTMGPVVELDGKPDKSPSFARMAS